MKRVLPPEAKKIQGWLLLNRRFDDANTMATIISHMENGNDVPPDYADLLKRFLKEYTGGTGNNNIKLRILRYFTSKYGVKNAEFIVSKLASVLTIWEENHVISAGEKIAIVNGWA